MSPARRAKHGRFVERHVGNDVRPPQRYMGLRRLAPRPRSVAARSTKRVRSVLPGLGLVRSQPECAHRRYSYSRCSGGRCPATDNVSFRGHDVHTSNTSAAFVMKNRCGPRSEIVHRPLPAFEDAGAFIAFRHGTVCGALSSRIDRRSRPVVTREPTTRRRTSRHSLARAASV